MTYLEECEENFRQENFIPAMPRIVDQLAAAGLYLCETESKAATRGIRKSLGISNAYECLCTSHEAKGPSGYPRGATLIDDIKGYLSPDLAPRAHAIYGFINTTPESRAVRYRKMILANLIDEALDKNGDQTKILAIACGHLREIDFCQSIKNVRPHTFITLNQDEQSLSEVSRATSHYGIKASRGSVRDLLFGKIKVDPMDLIYTAGLYDYLNNDIGRRLMTRVFSMLKSRGKLMISSFLPNIPVIDYVEPDMDLCVIYRDEKQMLDLTKGILQDEILSIDQYREPDENITFLEIIRK